MNSSSEMQMNCQSNVGLVERWIFMSMVLKPAHPSPTWISKLETNGIDKQLPSLLTSTEIIQINSFYLTHTVEEKDKKLLKVGRKRRSARNFKNHPFPFPSNPALVLLFYSKYQKRKWNSFILTYICSKAVLIFKLSKLSEKILACWDRN